MENENFKNKYANYLPSKKFAYSILTVAIGGIIIFAVAYLLSSKNHFFSKKEPNLRAENLTVNQLLQRDLDEDGVTDWEESLWGTDPNKKETFDGILDKIYIENRRKELGGKEEINAGELTETEKFAREFFASLAAMKASGEIDDSTINNFSSALGQKIASSPILNQYSEKDIELTKGDELADQEEYYKIAADLYEKYKGRGIGDELEIAGGLAEAEKNNVNDNPQELTRIAKAYKDFAGALLKIPAPRSLLKYHLEIINNANNTGIAVENMAKIATDPLIGISSLSQYQKYSEALIKSVQDLEDFLLISGIISE
jgi:hypothetical protein